MVVLHDSLRGRFRGIAVCSFGDCLLIVASAGNDGSEDVGRCE